MRILIFGDSITQGYFDTRGGWANRIMLYYQKQALADLEGDWTEVFNLGVSGDTTEGVLARIASETQSRRLFKDEECIVLAVGINDSILRDNRVIMDIEDFQAAYDKLIDQALELCPRVICVGLSGVDEKQADPWPYSSTMYQWKNNRIDLFEDTIKQSASLKEVPFVPIFDDFMALQKTENLLADGLHPNTAGHKLIASKVLPAIEALMSPADTLGA